MSKINSVATSSNESYFSKETKDFSYFIWTEATLFFGMLKIINSMDGYEIGGGVIHIGEAMLNTKSAIDKMFRCLKIAKFVNSKKNLLLVKSYIGYFGKMDQDGMAKTSSTLKEIYEGVPTKTEKTKVEISKGCKARTYSKNIASIGGAVCSIRIGLTALSDFADLAAFSMVDMGIIAPGSALFLTELGCTPSVIAGLSMLSLMGIGFDPSVAGLCTAVLLGMSFTVPVSASLVTILKLLSSTAMLYAVIVEYQERGEFLKKLNSDNVHAKMHLFRKESNSINTELTPKVKKLLEDQEDLIRSFRPENCLFGIDDSNIEKAKQLLAEISEDMQHKQNLELLKGLFISFTTFASCALAVSLLVINPASYAVMSQQVLLIVFYASTMANLLYENYMKNYSEEKESSIGDIPKAG